LYNEKLLLDIIVLEITSHCNARCVYCPQSVNPLPINTMSMDLFNHLVSIIVNECVIHDNFFVILNHTSEPLLDRYFKERIKILREYNIKIALFTNATRLTKSIIDYLKVNDFSNWGIIINFPSLDKFEWSQKMGLPEKLFDQTCNNIIKFIEKFQSTNVNIDIRLIKQYENETELFSQDSLPGHANLETPLFKKYKKSMINFLQKNNLSNVRISYVQGDDRCNTVHLNDKNKNHINSPPFHANKYLKGCSYKKITKTIDISYDGKIFLCCQDYKKEIILGDLTQNSLYEILNSELTNNYKNQIYGNISATDDLICRKCSHIII